MNPGFATLETSTQSGVPSVGVLQPLDSGAATRSAVLFGMLAAEAYVNQFLEIHLTGAEADAADRLPTFEKFMLGPRLAGATDLFDRGGEPAGTLKKLFNQRTPLSDHLWVAPAKSQGPTYTPLEVAEFIVAVADAAITLIANSNPRPGFDLAIVAVQETPEYFLDYGRSATEVLPRPDDPPSPDLVMELLTTQEIERDGGGRPGLLRSDRRPRPAPLPPSPPAVRRETRPVGLPPRQSFRASGAHRGRTSP